MRPALIGRLSYGSIKAVNSMEFNGVRPGPNIQFGLASDLRLSWRELNHRSDSCKQPTGKHYMRTKVRPASCKRTLWTIGAFTIAD